MMERSAIVGLIFFILLFGGCWGELNVSTSGIGSSSMYPLYFLWRSSFESVREEFIVSGTSYTSRNSEAGQDEMKKSVNETSYTYGASDSVLKDDAYTGHPDLQMIPVVAGGVAIIFNVPNIYSLNLTRDAIVGIYNGTITRWNDTRLTSVNPGITLPGNKIRVTARADYSGTTEIFTTALSSFSDEWNDTYGIFPDGLTDDGSDSDDVPIFWNPNVVSLFGRQSRGVAGVLFTYHYSIGYLSTADAVFSNFTYAKIFNKAGNLVDIDISTTKLIMADTIPHLGDRLTGSMVDYEYPDAYPIISYSYIIVHKTEMIDCNVAIELVRYILWMLDDESAQDQALDFKMAQIIPEIADLIKEQVLTQMTCGYEQYDLWELVQEQIQNEFFSTQPWRIPVFVVSPIVILLVLGLIIYNLRQRIMIRRAQLSDDWLIDFSEIQVKWDRDQGWSGVQTKSRAFGSTMTGMQSTASSRSGGWRYMWAGTIDILGYWDDHKVGLCKYPNPDYQINKRSTKMVINTLRVTLLHANVQRFFGVTFANDSIYLVREHCDKGSLTDVLQNSKYELDDNFKYIMALDVAKGMEFLHSKDMIHGKLDSDSCLLDSRWNVKVSGWEIKTLHKEHREKKLSRVAPISMEMEEENPDIEARRQVWVAPELLRALVPEATAEADVYSFGILLVEIFSRQDPYQELLDYIDPTQLIEKVKEGTRPSMEAIESKKIKPIMQSAWLENPSDRPSFSSLCRQIKSARPSKKSVIESMMETLEGYVTHLEDMVDDRTAELAAVNNSLETLLHQILPPSVAKSLSEGHTVQPEEYDSVSVFFSDIVKFTDLSSKSSPMNVVNLLNNLYTTFDRIVDSFDVYKIDTIGDAYMVISGLPARNGIKHAGQIASMAIHLMAAVDNFIIEFMPERKLQMRAGFHSGPVVAAVVGRKMPRYTLFGDTVNVASRMESNSVPMKIQTTDSSFKLLEKLGGYITKQRGDVEIKGKGKMRTYWVEGKIVADVLPTSATLRSVSSKERPKSSKPRPLTGKQRPSSGASTILHVADEMADRSALPGVVSDI